LLIECDEAKVRGIGLNRGGLSVDERLYAGKDHCRVGPAHAITLGKADDAAVADARIDLLAVPRSTGERIFDDQVAIKHVVHSVYRGSVMKPLV
jgi:hypothetical protein